MAAVDDRGRRIAPKAPPRKAKPARKKPIVRPDATSPGYAERRKTVPRIPLVIRADHRAKAKKAPGQYERGARQKLPKQVRRETAAQAVNRALAGKSLTSTEKRIVNVTAENLKRRRLGVDVGKPIAKQSPTKRIAHQTGTKTAAKTARDVATSEANKAVRSGLSKSLQARFDRDPNLRGALRQAARGKDAEAYARLPKDLQKKVKEFGTRQEKNAPLSKLGIEVPKPVRQVVRTAATAGAETVRYAYKHPGKATGELAKAVPDIAYGIGGTIAGGGQAVKELATTGKSPTAKRLAKEVVKDYKERYQDVYEGRPGARKALRKRVESGRFVPYALDVGVFAAPAAGQAATLGVKGATTGVLASSRAGRFVRAPRDKRQLTPQQSKDQRLSKTLYGIAGQRTLDAARRGQQRRLERKVAEGKITGKRAVEILQKPAPGTVKTLSSTARGPARKVSETRRTMGAARIVSRRQRESARLQDRELFGKSGSLAARLQRLPTEAERTAASIALDFGIRSTTSDASARQVLGTFLDQIKRGESRDVPLPRDAKAKIESLLADPDMMRHFTPEIDEFADFAKAQGQRIRDYAGVPVTARDVEAQQLGVGVPPLRKEKAIRKAEQKEARRIKRSLGPAVTAAQHTLDKERAKLATLREQAGTAQGRAEILSRNVEGRAAEAAAQRAGKAPRRTRPTGDDAALAQMRKDLADMDVTDPRRNDLEADIALSEAELGDLRGASLRERDPDEEASFQTLADAQADLSAKQRSLQGLREREGTPEGAGAGGPLLRERIASLEGEIEALKGKRDAALRGWQKNRKTAPIEGVAPKAGPPRHYAGGGLGATTTKAALNAQRVQVKIAEQRLKAAKAAQRAKVKVEFPRVTPAQQLGLVEDALPPDVVGAGFQSHKPSEPVVRQSQLNTTRTSPPISSKEKAVREGVWRTDPQSNLRANQQMIEYREGQRLLYDMGQRYAIPQLGDTKIPARGIKARDLEELMEKEGFTRADYGMVKAAGDNDLVHLVTKDVEQNLKALLNPPSKASTRGALATKVQSTLLLGTSPSWLAFQLFNNALAVAHNASAFAKLIPNLKAIKGLSEDDRLQLDLMAGIGSPHDALSGDRVATRYLGSTHALGKFYHAVFKPWVKDPLGLFQLDHYQNIGWRRLVAVNHLRKRMESMDATGRQLLPLQERLHETLAALSTPASKLLDSEDAARAYAEATAIAEDAASQVVKLLGDYSAFTPRERAILHSNVLFYGYMRYSIRLMFYTLPVQHPAYGALLAQLGQIHAKEVRELLGPGTLPYQLGSWYMKDGAVQVSGTRTSPLLNVLTQLDIDKPTAAILATHPMAWAAFEALSGKDLFKGGAPIKVVGAGGKPVEAGSIGLPGKDWENRARIFLSKVIDLGSLSRQLREPKARIDPETGFPRERTGESLPFSPRYARTPAAKVPRVREELEQRGSLKEQLIRQNVPFAEQPSHARSRAEVSERFERERELTDLRSMFEETGSGRDYRREVRRAERESAYGVESPRTARKRDREIRRLQRRIEARQGGGGNATTAELEDMFR